MFGIAEIPCIGGWRNGRAGRSDILVLVWLSSAGPPQHDGCFNMRVHQAMRGRPSASASMAGIDLAHLVRSSVGGMPTDRSSSARQVLHRRSVAVCVAELAVGFGFKSGARPLAFRLT
jgi:hypothetical protein